mmetsp:Transcript_58944/g.113666  ORF Transcript_58944/g.113666 Transcript_58944/m.113666 type:complete len:118 (+) Transcript_58944:61-414(+)
MSSPWECVCEFIRSQSANLQNVLDGLSNQHTISDLDVNDTLTINSGISPLNLFMFLLLAVWGFLYVQGRNRGSEKPAGSSFSPSSPSADGNNGNNNSEGGNSSGSGGGVGTSADELY